MKVLLIHGSSKRYFDLLLGYRVGPEKLSIPDFLSKKYKELMKYYEQIDEYSVPLELDHLSRMGKKNVNQAYIAMSMYIFNILKEIVKSIEIHELGQEIKLDIPEEELSGDLTNFENLDYNSLKIHLVNEVPEYLLYYGVDRLFRILDNALSIYKATEETLPYRPDDYKHDGFLESDEVEVYSPEEFYPDMHKDRTMDDYILKYKRKYGLIDTGIYFYREIKYCDNYTYNTNQVKSEHRLDKRKKGNYTIYIDEATKKSVDKAIDEEKTQKKSGYVLNAREGLFLLNSILIEADRYFNLLEGLEKAHIYYVDYRFEHYTGVVQNIHAKLYQILFDLLSSEEDKKVFNKAKSKGITINSLLGQLHVDLEEFRNTINKLAKELGGEEICKYPKHYVAETLVDSIISAIYDNQRKNNKIYEQHTMQENIRFLMTLKDKLGIVDFIKLTKKCIEGKLGSELSKDPKTSLSNFIMRPVRKILRSFLTMEEATPNFTVTSLYAILGSFLTTEEETEVSTAPISKDEEAWKKKLEGYEKIFQEEKDKKAQMNNLLSRLIFNNNGCQNLMRIILVPLTPLDLIKIENKYLEEMEERHRIYKQNKSMRDVVQGTQDKGMKKMEK